MNIIIVNTQQVPSSVNGAASVNRILSYAKGLIENDNSVKIISTSTNKDGQWHTYDGVPVRHVGGNPKNRLSRFICLCGVSFRLIKALLAEKIDVLLFVTSNYFLIILLELYCCLTRTKIVNEKSEYPFVLMTKNKLKRVFAPFYTYTAYRLLDGMILMTKPLYDYYKTKVGKKCVLHEMPMTVDTERFDIEKGQNGLGDYIAYCGNMAGNKDGVINLISAFDKASAFIGEINLLLIGGASNKEDWDNIELEVKRTNNPHIVLFGKATREQIPHLLKNAKALALARPSSLQSTGGFPTKLGEYLATGNPVVVTAVGDIPFYLNENNAFVVEPDNNEKFSEAIIRVFSDYSRAIEVGKNGQKLAKTVFSAKEQAHRLNDYLLKICE